MLKLRFLALLLVGCLVLGGCSGEVATETLEPNDVIEPISTPTPETYTQEQHDDTLTFTTTMRIHESLPEFTFRRIVGDIEPEPWYGDFPAPREVTIIIEDDEGNVIQAISELTQNHFFIEDKEIEFDDYNFDGYLDMRLKRWQDGAGGLLAYEYFWLWSTDTSQFVLNEQLVEIEAADIAIDSNEQHIVIYNRGDYNSGNLDFYKYHDGEFIFVANTHYLPTCDEYGQYIHTIVTHTNMLTGEITIEIEPTP